MCWNFAASIIFTTLGLIAATYLIIKKDDKYLWIPFIYFSLMELLQVFTYLYLNQCDLPANQVLTYLSYLHIAFQPFFMNMIFMHFIPKKVRANISLYVYTACFAATILMLLKAYPFPWAEPCKIGTSFCGTQLCSVSGKLHLGWMLPKVNLGFIITYAYAFSVFLLPFIYGSWKTGAFQIIFGPILAKMLTNNPIEWPAVWCLFSIAIFMVIFIPKLRKWFYVKKWYLWDYPKLLNK
jgi:hypothetical protein